MIEFITDGAYSSSRDQGGASVVCVVDGKLAGVTSKGFKHTTNNQMEMIAIMMALLSIKQPIEECNIISDSMYCIGMITNPSWQRKKNVELWDKFDKIYSKALSLCPNINFIHVRGHSKSDSEYNKWNEMADQLAVEASHDKL